MLTHPKRKRSRVEDIHPNVQSDSKQPEIIVINAAPSASVGEIMSFQKYVLDHILLERGYDATLYSVLSQMRFNSVTDHRIVSYTLEVKKSVVDGNVEKLKELHEKGVSMTACNKYGESILHMAARLGNEETFSFLFNHAETKYISDDQGRTVLHDACWSACANFNIVTEILEQDSSFIQMTDTRGFTPLAYVKKDEWGAWIHFFDTIKDKYWPVLEGTGNKIEA